MNFSSLVRLGAATALAVAAVHAGAASAQYTLVDLGLNVSAGQINEHGQIAGGIPGDKAAVYRNGAWHPVAGKRKTVGVAINAAGDMAGVTGGRLTSYQATLWPQGGARVLLAVPAEGSSAYPRAIDAQQRVVGSYVNADLSAGYCAVWQGPGVTTLPPMGAGDTCDAVGIDAQGRIAGSSNLVAGGPFHAFVWANGVYQDLGTTGLFNDVEANGMNSLGHVVGRLGFAGSPASDGFFYDGQSMVDLGTLGFGNAAATAINDKDQIVGYASMADGRELATLFTTGRGFVALDKLVDELDDWQLNEALSINDHGVIIGIGTRRDGVHAFMLTPIAD